MLYQLLVVSVAVIGKRVDGDAATRGENSLDLDIARIHQFHEVFHDDVDAVLVKIAVVAEAEKIEFQALALDHALARDIGDDDAGKIRLPRLGAQGGELGTCESHEIFVVLMFVDESFKHLGGILHGVLRPGVTEQRYSVKFSGRSHNSKQYLFNNAKLANIADTAKLLL